MQIIFKWKKKIKGKEKKPWKKPEEKTFSQERSKDKKCIWLILITYARKKRMQGNIERKTPPGYHSVFCRIILQKWRRNKDFLWKRKVEGICCQQTWLARKDVFFFFWKKIIYFRILDLYKGRTLEKK